jgi:EmrB/QacA subfamily drug resistance transporter
LRRSLLLPLIVSCALFIEQMDSTVLSTSLPLIARDLGVDPIALKLALTSYLVSLAVFIPVSGWIADRFGARTTFTTAIAIFLLGSIACAASSSLPALVAARALQGMGGAMMVPVGRLVILRSIPRSEIVAALTYLTMPALIGPMIGPPLGGFITTYFHWRWIFLINLPMGLVGIALARRFIPDLREPDAGRLDRVGFVLSGIGLAATMLGLATVWEPMLPIAISLACAAVGVVALAAFVWHARRTPRPLIDLSLFRVPTFRAGVVGGAFFRIGQGATPFLLPLMLQVGFGLTPFRSGLLTFASAVGALFMKTVATRILRRWGFRTVLLVNAIVASSMFAAYGMFRADTPHTAVLAVLLVGGCLRSLQFTSLGAISYAEISTEAMSAATSLASVVQQLAISAGVTVGAYALQVASWLHGGTSAHDLQPGDFQLAFFTVALFAASSVLWFVRLPTDAGRELAGGPTADAQPSG